MHQIMIVATLLIIQAALLALPPPGSHTTPVHLSNVQPVLIPTAPPAVPTTPSAPLAIPTLHLPPVPLAIVFPASIARIQVTLQVALHVHQPLVSLQIIMAPD